MCTHHSASTMIDWLRGILFHLHSLHLPYYFKPNPVHQIISSVNISAHISKRNHHNILILSLYFSSAQLLSHVWLFVTLWTAALQVSLSITNSQSLLKLMSIESVMLSNHLILCRRLLLPPSIFPSIRVFSSTCSHHVVKVLELQLQHQSFQWIFQTDFL